MHYMYEVPDNTATERPPSFNLVQDRGAQAGPVLLRLGPTCEVGRAILLLVPLAVLPTEVGSATLSPRHGTPLVT